MIRSLVDNILRTYPTKEIKYDSFHDKYHFVNSTDAEIEFVDGFLLNFLNSSFGSNSSFYTIVGGQTYHGNGYSGDLDLWVVVENSQMDFKTFINRQPKTYAKVINRNIGKSIRIKLQDVNILMRYYLNTEGYLEKIKLFSPEGLRLVDIHISAISPKLIPLFVKDLLTKAYVRALIPTSCISYSRTNTLFLLEIDNPDQNGNIDDRWLNCIPHI